MPGAFWSWCIYMSADQTYYFIYTTAEAGGVLSGKDAPSVVVMK